MMAGSIRASPAECMIPYLRGLSIGGKYGFGEKGPCTWALGLQDTGAQKAASNPPRHSIYYTHLRRLMTVSFGECVFFE